MTADTPELFAVIVTAWIPEPRRTFAESMNVPLGGVLTVTFVSPEEIDRATT